MSHLVSFPPHLQCPFHPPNLLGNHFHRPAKVSKGCGFPGRLCIHCLKKLPDLLRVTFSFGLLCQNYGRTQLFTNTVKYRFLVFVQVITQLLNLPFQIKKQDISLVASCVPLFARLVESSLLELDKGKIEAAKAMGSGNMRILFQIMVPETMPSLVRAFTNAVVIIISMTALAGSFGAGGIGYIAVTYGYTRFEHDLLFATIIVLIVIVQAVQILGDTISKIILKRRHLI